MRRCSKPHGSQHTKPPEQGEVVVLWLADGDRLHLAARIWPIYWSADRPNLWQLRSAQIRQRIV